MAEVETANVVVGSEPTATNVSIPAPTWRDSLPDDLKADKSLESFKDVPALAKSYIETKRMVGAKQSVTPPNEKSTPEEVKAWRQALGVPESPEAYKIKPHPIMGLPDWNKDAEKGFYKLAHEINLPPASAEKVLHYYADFIGQTLKSNDVMAAEAKAELRTEWGVNYDAFLGAANNGMSRVAQAIGVAPGDLAEATKGSDPAVVAKAFHWIESQFTEHGWVQGEPVRGMSSLDAQSKMAEIDAQLKTVDPYSDRARQLTEEKMRYLTAAMRAA